MSFLSPQSYRLNKNDIFIIAIAILAVVLRLLPHLPNIAPIGALFVVSGLIAVKKSRLIIPLLALLISDIFTGFYSPLVMTSVYLGFLIMAAIGYFFKKHQNALSAVMSSLAGSLSFFLLTNFAVWAFTPMYEKNLIGLFESYFMAAPFFRNSLIGDLGYVILFWFAYKLVIQRKNIPVLSKTADFKLISK